MINAHSGTAQPAIDGTYLELRVLRHFPQKRGHRLLGMPTNKEHLVAVIRHEWRLDSDAWPPMLLLKERTKMISSAKVYLSIFTLSLRQGIPYNFYGKSRGEVAERLKAAAC
jgi:hypothetical protein